MRWQLVAFCCPQSPHFGLSLCLAMQSKGMVGESQSLCAIVEVFGVDVEAYGVVQNNKFIVTGNKGQNMKGTRMA